MKTPFTIDSATCIYQIKVIAFEDLNGDGVQNPGEPGIAGVKVSLQHSRPMYDNATPEQTYTDSTGLTSFARDGACKIGDKLTINIAPLSGYRATTPLTFGPYFAPEMTYESLTQLPKDPPSMIYVGLRKN